MVFNNLVIYFNICLIKYNKYREKGREKKLISIVYFVSLIRNGFVINYLKKS